MTEEIKLTPEQQVAVDEVEKWVKSPFSKMLSFTGAAGTGKTVSTAFIKKLLPGATSWAAMTGKAALRLSELAGVSARTLHATVYKPPINKGKYLNFSAMKKPDCQYLVLDEAGMAGPKIFYDLQDWINKGVKVLFIGDGYQLPPIMTLKEEQEHGEDFIIFREVKGPSLTTVMRSGGGIIQFATEVRETQKIPTKGNESVSIEQTKYPGLAAIKEYLADPEDHVLITWTNRLRMQGNEEIRRKLGFTGLLPGPTEPVLICKNGQDRLNGEVVYATGFTPGPKLADVSTMWMHVNDGSDLLVTVNGKDQPMDGFMPNVKDWREYHQQRNNQDLDEPLPITYGYVMTCHKMQGNQARRVSVFLSGSDISNQHFNKLTRLPSGEQTPFSIRWLYTSATRAKDRVNLYIG